MNSGKLNHILSLKFKHFTHLFILTSLLTFISCVPDDPCESSSTRSPASSDNLQADASCDSPTDPGNGDGGDNSEPLPPADPGETNQEALNAPWKNTNTAIVIDAYQGNPINWDQMASDERVVGVIHRSSIGLRTDTKYLERRRIAKERGYLWGAYHLGYTGNVRAQVDLFLKLVDDDPDTLMILDLENTTNGTFMTIKEAAQFMDMVYERTGRIPVVYANHSTTKMLNQQMANNPLFQQSKLWYARFKSHVTDYPSGIWPNYFLWQFSSEINCSRTGSCLYNVPGTKFDMDVNVYYGSESDLRLNWNND